jgi:FAD/FMN-containing dehydrogenase
MKPLPENSIRGIESFLLSQSAHRKVKEQHKARELALIDGKDQPHPQQHQRIRRLKELLSDASEVFRPDEVQQIIYSADTGTHMLPESLKKRLLNIRTGGVVRPGTIEDTRRFMEWAYKNDVRYTIRGAATWPFGGCVPLNNDMILDLSYLDFMKLPPPDEKNEDGHVFAFGAGVIFPQARNYLKKQGFGLLQEVTNPYSGTITGWIATGGFGLGSYKYGHVKESVRLLMVIQPDGQLKTVSPGDEGFDSYFGSEGHLGVIAAAVMNVRKDNYFTRPYGFSFKTFERVRGFIELLRDSGITPTSVLYFDEPYIKETYAIEKEHAEKHSLEALERNDRRRTIEAREDLDVIAQLETCRHVVVLHFDDPADYQTALKTRLFAGETRKRRIRELKFRQLSTPLAHRLWAHRYLPV